jgi:hypothetical protein
MFDLLLFSWWFLYIDLDLFVTNIETLIYIDNGIRAAPASS